MREGKILSHKNKKTTFNNLQGIVGICYHNLFTKKAAAGFPFCGFQVPIRSTS